MGFFIVMISVINNYFLSGFKNEPHFERKKAAYLCYIILCVFTMVTVSLITQVMYRYGFVYYLGDSIAFAGILCSLYLFKKKDIEAAGHTMIMASMMMIIIQNIFRDIYVADPAMRYRIYLTAAGLFGTYFMIIAFFRKKKVIYFYGIMFEIVLTTHSLVIYFNLRHIPNMPGFIFQHFLTVFGGVIVVASISTWLLMYMEALFQQNKEYAILIEEQNGRLEEMVTDRTRALSRSNENLREFAHIVSHDLKEPLRTISGFVSLIKKELQKQGLENEEIEEYMSYVQSGTYQMEALIGDILTYSKLNAVEQQMDVVNVADVLKEVRSSLAKSIYESEVRINILDLENVSGEKRLVVQLFQNLVSNAIKYRRTNVEAIISIGSTKRAGMVTYYVRDNGIGVDQQYFKTIFQAFKRLHSKADYEGTGVGLAICKKIVDIHRGRIWIESEEGKGSTFYFTLPEAQTETPEICPVVHAA